MASLAFLGLAHTFKSGEMVRVGLLTDRLTGRAKWIAEIFALVMAAIFTGFFAWQAVLMTYTSWLINDTSTGVIVVPLWIPQLGFTSGLVILFIAVMDELVHVLAGNKPRYEKEPPKTAEEVIERAAAGGV
jgi:TRAP-type C4-dicarboxylate transport system permease small subunit